MRLYTYPFSILFYFIIFHSYMCIDLFQGMSECIVALLKIKKFILYTHLFFHHYIFFNEHL